MEAGTSSNGSGRRVYTFGDFTLDLERDALSKSGTQIKLRPKSFDVLAFLVQAHGRVVSKDELLSAVWGSVVVTESSITQCLLDIRRALDDRSQRFIRTVPRRGYLFDAPVSEVDGARSLQKDAPIAITAPPPSPRPTFRSPVIAASIIVAAVALAALALALLRSDPITRMLPAAADIAPKSIAVLQFADLSHDHDQQYLADGIAEEILGVLARTSDLRVIARTSSFSIKEANGDVAAIAERLGVRYVLEGSVRKSNEQVRVSAKLVDATTRSPVWSETYDRKLEDALALQSDIAAAVAKSLKAKLVHPQSVDRVAQANPEAFAYLQGRFFHNRRMPGDMDRAVKAYDDALRIDPRFARAWFGIAAASAVQIAEGAISRDAGYAKRRAAIERALALDPNLAEAHVAAASLAWDNGDVNRAREHWRMAVAAEPDNPIVLQLSSNIAAWNDRLDDAVKLGQRIVMLDPLSAVSREALASYLLANGQFEDAKEQIRKQSELNPGSKEETEHWLGFTLILQRRFEEVLQLVERWPEGRIATRLSR